MKTGRPSEYTVEIGTAICARIAEGESIRKIVADNTMPSSSTIFRWLLDEDKKEFWEQYEKARNIQAELMFEEILSIADDEEKEVMRSRLKVDARKWYLSKVLPKKFGDKLDLTTKDKELPQPILNVVLPNHSNKEGDGDEEENTSDTRGNVSE